MSRRSPRRAARWRSGWRRQFPGLATRSPARTRTSSSTRSLTSLRRVGPVVGARTDPLVTEVPPLVPPGVVPGASTPGVGAGIGADGPSMHQRGSVELVLRSQELFVGDLAEVRTGRQQRLVLPRL